MCKRKRYNIDYLINISSVAIGLFLLACNESPVKIERPNEVWVTRSVLDKRPRMINIALNKNIYVAYSTQLGALYKVWQGRINYDGAVYNEVHGFQPSSQGYSFIEEPAKNPWSIRINGNTIVPDVIYKGHVFNNQQVSLKYNLCYRRDTIYVQETPEYFAIGGDTTKLGFERRFTISRLPDNTDVLIDLQAGEGSQLYSYKANGHFEIATNQKEKNVRGRLVLNKEETFFLQVYARPVAIEHGEEVKEATGAEALLENKDCAGCHNKDVHTVGPAYMDIARRYAANTGEYVDRLAMKIINGGSGNWGNVPMTPHPDLNFDQARSLVDFIIAMDSATHHQSGKRDNTGVVFNDPGQKTEEYPGDGAPLKDVHPAFTLSQARPAGLHPRVGGMDFLPDGRMVICTWDPEGSVYVLDGLRQKDSTAITVKRIASGLAEPLGLKVVDGEIYVLQKQELTHLKDNDRDEIIDEYETVCNSWKVSDNFHEFAFGLIYRDGFFYATLATAVNYGGSSAQPQIPDRGKVIKISRKDGSCSFIASGLRTPNGIGIGVDNEIFIADNQGDWLPANKIVHMQTGAWYGSRSVDFEGTKGLTPTMPVVWLPQGEIANSPSQVTVLNKGPYKNQMIYGDVTHGGVKRVFAEKVNGKYQGAVFRFSQGLEAGINRMIWGPDSALYVGGIGSSGNWGHPGKLTYGLQRLEYNHTAVFEMLAIRAKHNGIEIEFTSPLGSASGNELSAYTIKQWWYQPTENYGGPKMNEEKLDIKSIRLSADRRKVLLELPGMKPEHILYVRLDRKAVLSEANQPLWSTEAWYTMNSIPD